MKGNRKQYFNMVKASAERGEIHIYGDIVSEGWRYGEDETSAVSFRDALNDLGDVQDIDLYINSGGGDVFEAAAVYNMLKRHKARVNVHVDGLAASAASVIAMAGDKVTMPSNAVLMIHNAWSLFAGNHHDFRKFADNLEKINENTVKQAYISKNPDLDVEELSNMMDKESWISASEALEMGLVDEVTDAVQVAASISDDQLARYKNAPTALTQTQDETPKSESAPITAEIIQKMIDDAVTAKLQQTETKEPDEEPVKNGLQRLFLNL